MSVALNYHQNGSTVLYWMPTPPVDSAILLDWVGVYGQCRHCVDQSLDRNLHMDKIFWMLVLTSSFACCKILVMGMAIQFVCFFDIFLNAISVKSLLDVPIDHFFRVTVAKVNVLKGFVPIVFFFVPSSHSFSLSFPLMQLGKGSKRQPSASMFFFSFFIFLCRSSTELGCTSWQAS